MEFQTPHRSDKRRLLNASKTGMKGTVAPMLSRSGSSVNRKIDTTAILDCLKVNKVLTSISSLTKLCFPGLDLTVKPLDDSDDTQTAKIDEAQKQLRRTDVKVGQVGKVTRVGTVGLVRRTMLETLCFRSSAFEYEMVNEDGWLTPNIQHLPSKSFVKAPDEARNNDKLIADSLLPGLVYDANGRVTKFYQTFNSSSAPIELDPEQIIYIEDPGIPEDAISFMASLVPVVREWQTMRRNLEVAMHRIGSPTMTAKVNIPTQAEIEACEINIGDVIDYAKALIQAQSTETAAVAIPGMDIQYPSISMPINPIEPDQYLKREIVEAFFNRDILEVAAQAISSTSAPTKALLDMLIGSYQETNGKPFEIFWTEKWLWANGFDSLKVEFDYWSLVPKDPAAIHKEALDGLVNRGITINEYRTAHDMPPLDEAGIEQMAKEYAYFGAGML